MDFDLGLLFRFKIVMLGLRERHARRHEIY